MQSNLVKRFGHSCSITITNKAEIRKSSKLERIKWDREEIWCSYSQGRNRSALGEYVFYKMTQSLIQAFSKHKQMNRNLRL